MSDASDVQHHLEEGLLLFTRGTVFEARQSWRKVLQIEPRNASARDYLESTVRELNPYEQRREDELVKDIPARGGPRWEEDENEVFAAGSAEDDDDSLSASLDTASVTGYLLDDDGAEVAANGQAGAADFVMAGEEEDEDWDMAVDAAPGSAPEAPSSAAFPTEGEHDSEPWDPESWVNEITPAVALDPGQHSRRSKTRAEGGERASLKAAATPAELMARANECLRIKKPEQARDLLLKLLELEPDHPGAMELLEQAITDMLELYSEVLGDNDGVPELNPSAMDLFSLNLDEVGGYILSRIDGILTLEDIYTLSAHIDRLQVMRILVDLAQSGAISIRH